MAKFGNFCCRCCKVAAGKQVTTAATGMDGMDATTVDVVARSASGAGDMGSRPQRGGPPADTGGHISGSNRQAQRSAAAWPSGECEYEYDVDSI